MAISMWRLSAIALGMTVLNWFLTPLIALLLPKFIAYLSFDAPQKFRDLEFDIIPRLKMALTEVDEQRLLKEAKKTDRGNLKLLNDRAGRLRHARYEAEDILDLIDYHRIKRKVTRDGESHNSSWLQWKWWVQRFYGDIGQRDGDFLHMSGAQLPIYHAHAVSWVRRIYCWFRFIDFKNLSFWKMGMKNCFTSLVNFSAKAIKGTYYCVYYFRERFFMVVGIRNYGNYEDIAIALETGLLLKKRIEELENMLVEKPHVFNLPSNGAQEKTANKTRSNTSGSPTPTKRKVFGRDIERDNIIKRLCEGLDDSATSSSKCYSVIGICGIAGSGKTTLAQHVYDCMQQDKRFDATMFIHVSETFTVKDIFRDMLKGVLKLDNIEDCEDVQVKLENELRGKRFFLVLDDRDNNEKLNKLLSPLDAGKKGSKILVTSRSNDAARGICDDEPIAIPDLDEEQYLSMFMHYALDGSGVDDWLLIPVGRKIAAKLLRSPIAAVTVAGQLRRRPYINVWETTAVLDVLNGTRGALWWSYQQLDADIRRCFEYCTIFPRRFQLKRKELIRLWLAQGFVKTSDATEDMEDIAEGYFQDLVSCSFLQKEETSAYTYHIHDLLHDLAEVVTGSDCFRIENNGPRWTGNIPLDVRHLFIENYDAALITGKILELEHLRTLIIYSAGQAVTVQGVVAIEATVAVEDSVAVEDTVIKSIFKRLLKLRVLAVAKNGARMMGPPPLFSVPESINQLRHLRYLAFGGSFFSRVTLPSTLQKLYHIQQLGLYHSEKLEFPYADLINLRHVFCEGGVEFHNVGRLTSLQTMGQFSVKNKQGHGITQLRDLNKLGGELHISGLQNVKSKEEALEANLAAKERLRQLRLSWDRGYLSHNPEVQAQVLEGLCPPVELQRLKIVRYKSFTYPNWMVDKHSNGPKNLHELCLSDWSQPGPAPALGAFIHLRRLELSCCNWNALPGNMEKLTSLEKLIISECMNIQSLPALPESLEYIELNSCNYEFLKFCATREHPNWRKIVHIPMKLIHDYRVGTILDTVLGGTPK